VTRKDGKVYHDVSIVSIVRKPEMNCMKKNPTIVDVAQSLGKPRKFCV
jgi:hypothetical protein